MKVTIYISASLFAAWTPSVSASSAFNTLDNLPADIISNLPHDMPFQIDFIGRDLEEGSCTPCANGETPTIVDATIPEYITATDATEGETITCSQYAGGVGFFADDSIECSMIQTIGFMFCGCPSAPTLGGGEPCTICSDGSPIPDPSKEIANPSAGESLTCAELQLGAFFADAAMGEDETTAGARIEALDGVEICPSIQNMYGPMCDCPDDPNAPPACSICPEGMELANPDKKIPVEDGVEMTCGEGETMIAAQFSADTEVCDLIKSEAEAFGCTCKTVAPTTVAPTTAPPMASTTVAPSTAPTIASSTAHTTSSGLALGTGIVAASAMAAAAAAALAVAM